MIELHDISKAYGSVEVIKGVSLTIPRGEVVSIVGPSGAGKTTLLQIMGTLERADHGSVTYDGCDVMSLGDKALSRFRNLNIGFVFQFHRLLPEFTLLENIAMPALINGTPKRQAMDRALELARYTGIAHRADHKPSELSGGECQRAAVARALVNRPKVVLADEPSGSLDSQNRRELQNLFFSLRDDTDTTFVIVTHDESLASECNRVIHMRDGRIVGQ